MNDKEQAMETLKGLKSIIKSLIDDQKKLSKDYIGRIEQLEAEVESWKASYERVNRERAELALRLQVSVDDLEEEIANSELP